MQTNIPLPPKYKSLWIFFLIEIKNSLKFHFIKIPDAPTTNKRFCRVENKSPMANRINPDNFSWKWVCSVVLQKIAVEISEVRSVILKKCEADAFRSANWWLRGFKKYQTDYWSLRWVKSAFILMKQQV